jgi:hypothetical protein
MPYTLLLNTVANPNATFNGFDTVGSEKLSKLGQENGDF